MSRAEADFRAAFERLKVGTPQVLPMGARVSQNNVAREAGKDPSALKKARVPSLVEEIQLYVSVFGDGATATKTQAALRRRKRNRNLKEILRDVTAERDLAVSQLLEANLRILELHERLAEAEAELPATNVRSFPPTRYTRPSSEP